MKTTAQTMHAIGQVVDYRMGDLTISVTVMDVKTVWGKTRIQITPLSGTGSQWVNIESLSNVSQVNSLAVV